MRAYTLCLAALIGCVGDDNSTTKDSGNDVTTTNDGSPNDVITTDASDAGAWSPTTFGNALVLWLEGDVGVGADDAGGLTWQDQSPSPVTFTGSALTDTTPNGHVVLNFNATNVFVETPSVAKLELGATDDFIIATVMQTTTGSTEPPGAFAFEKAQTVGQLPFKSWGDGLIFGTNITGKSGQPELYDLTANKDAGGDLLSSKNIDDGAYHVLLGRRVGSTSRSRSATSSTARSSRAPSRSRSRRSSSCVVLARLHPKRSARSRATSRPNTSRTDSRRI
jgi:hypothetical protein